MQEHVVQHEVEVGARQLVRLVGVEAREGGGVVAQVRAVGGERGVAERERSEARECGVHEAQIHEQGIFCEVEGLAGKRLDRFGRHGGSFDGRRVQR